MSPARQWKAQRAPHLAAALVLFAYVYAPFGTHLHDVARFIVFPTLALTGIAMWQAARIRRLRKTVARKRAPTPPSGIPSGLHKGEPT